MPFHKLFLTLSLALALGATTIADARPASVTSTVDLARLVDRVTPGAEHAALVPLVGTWRVEKSLFVAMGTADRPAHSDGMTTTRTWVADGKFLADKTTGTINGHPYERIGYLGYNNMDRRYEWNTIDNVTTIMMTFHGAKGNVLSQRLDMRGAFTDPGVTGEANVGKTVQMRMRIVITDADHHSFQIFLPRPAERKCLPIKWTSRG